MTTNRGNNSGAEPHDNCAPGRSAMKPDPKNVADQFSHQYYTVFSNYPRYLYRFYDTASTMTVSEVLDNGTVKAHSAETQEGIHELVLELFEDTTVKLGHVLPQFSQNGGIAMQVNGTLLRKGVEQTFAQSFFLAVQDKGFYVLNDILHITPANPGTSPRKENPPAVATPVQVRPAVPRKPPKEVTRTEVVAPTHPYPQHSNVPVHSNGREMGHGGTTGVHPGGDGAPQTKPTYAQLLKVSAGNSGTQVMSTNVPETRVQRPVTPTSPAETPHSQSASIGLQGNANGTGPNVTSNFQHRLNTSSYPRNSSVFVRDIPPNVDENTLRQAFAEYGDVTSVVIRNGRRDLRFAFVDYATTEAMDECLRQNVSVSGRQLYVEEKKPLVLRNKPRFRRAGSGSPGSSPH